METRAAVCECPECGQPVYWAYTEADTSILLDLAETREGWALAPFALATDAAAPAEWSRHPLHSH